MATVLLCALTLALAVFALTQRRLLWGVIGVGVHSLALAAVYLFLAAPDVALTEAAIGFGLVTFVYLLALRRTGRLVVAASETYPILHQEGERIAGLEWEILSRFGRSLHRDVEVLWVPRSEIPRLLASAEADLAAGGFLPRDGETALLSFPLVPTRLVTVRTGPGPLGAVAGDRGQDHLPSEGRTYEDHEALVRAIAAGELGGAVVDLLRARQWFLEGRLRDAEMVPIEDGLAFRFAVSPGEGETHAALEEFLRGLSSSGELSKLVEEHLR
ncbi:MAG: hydrogenase subunit MbhD domain-containing protein [Candidatus Bipolaricaulota bacterium]